MAGQGQARLTAIDLKTMLNAVHADALLSVVEKELRVFTVRAHRLVGDNLVVPLLGQPDDSLFATFAQHRQSGQSADFRWRLKSVDAECRYFANSQSGPDHQPEHGLVSWVRDLLEECRHFGIRCISGDCLPASHREVARSPDWLGLTPAQGRP